MEQSSNKSSLSFECQKHPKKQQQFIHISDSTGQPLNCIQCIREKRIQLQDTFLISDIMDDQNQLLLSNFPPLTDSSLYDEIRKIIQQESQGDDDEILSQIDKFFQDLQKQIEKTINVAKIEAKQKFLQFFQIKNEVSKVYHEISLTQELKAILKQEKEVEKKISQILKNLEMEKIKNTQILKEILKNNKKSFDLDVPQKATEQIINQISKINFFSGNSSSRNLILSSNLKKSTLEKSEQLEITKTEQTGFIVKSLKNGNKVAYLDFNLDPNKQYVFRVNIWMKNGSDAFIAFGLLEENNIDLQYLGTKKISYSERGDEYGLKKVVKGGQLHKGSIDQEINRQFEMRIDLKNKFIRVADFPDYSSVCELDDSNKISPTQAYRFGVGFYYESSITISEILEVDAFDDKM